MGTILVLAVGDPEAAALWESEKTGEASFN